MRATGMTVIICVLSLAMTRITTKFLLETLYQPHDKRQQQAYQQHGTDGYIDTGVFTFIPDIARQSAQKPELVIQQPNQAAGRGDQQSYEHNQFANFIHYYALGGGVKLSEY